MKTYGIYIGRFQPLHNAHEAVIHRALKEVDELIIVLGSASQARTIKNPWSSGERKAMVCSVLSDEEANRTHFVEAKDYYYNNNMWLTTIQRMVYSIINRDNTECNVKLFGHKKDNSTFYLNLFPQWEFVETGEYQIEGLSATKVRDLYFDCNLISIKNVVPPEIANYLQRSMMNGMDLTIEFKRLKDEYDFIVDYKKQWANTPYPVLFATTDAVVIKSGHVLLVRRAGQPGRGLLALPGGFIDPNERIRNACIRELKEETKISLNKDDLNVRVVDEKVFDHPERSLRGRTISHAYCIDLGQGNLPDVKGCSVETKGAFWMPLRDVFASEEQFFEDHYHIILHFVNKF